MNDLRYPIGEAPDAAGLTPDGRATLIAQLAELPAQLRQAVEGLSDAQLDTPYRDGGWTVRQVVHHVPDSHLNAYVRVKLALTEDAPTIKPYDEQAWAQLPDSKLPVEASLRLLEALHERWVALWQALSGDGWRRGFFHPEARAFVPLGAVLATYAWHGRHHLAHITGLRKRMNW